LIPSIVYNIPALMVRSFPGRTIVVRSADPSEIIQSLEHVDVKRLSYLQILGTGGAIDSLMRWEHATPIDLVIQDPVSDLPQLYRYSPLIAERPVRVTVRVATGFSKVVKLALSLNFAVKLEVSQPEPALIEELLQAASLYLHSSTVSQTVESSSTVSSGASTTDTLSPCGLFWKKTLPACVILPISERKPFPDGLRA
jgi:hypothetical protein